LFEILLVVGFEEAGYGKDSAGLSEDGAGVVITATVAEAVAVFDVRHLPAVIFADDFHEEVAVLCGKFADGIGVIHLDFGSACHVGGVFGEDFFGQVDSPWFRQSIEGGGHFGGDGLQDIFAAACFPCAEEFAEGDQEVHEFDGGFGGAGTFFLLSEHDVIDHPASFGGVFDEDELVFGGSGFFLCDGFAAALFVVGAFNDFQFAFGQFEDFEIAEGIGSAECGIFEASGDGATELGFLVFVECGGESGDDSQFGAVFEYVRFLHESGPCFSAKQ